MTMPDSTEITQTEPTAPSRATWWHHPALYLALAALLFTGWQWREQRQQTRSIQLEVAKRTAQDEEIAKQLRANFDKAQASNEQSQQRLGQLENKLGEAESQYIALDSLYRQLAGNPDEISLAEVEQTIGIANQQLQLAGNPKAALIALQAADTRLARNDKPQWTSLRKSISADMEKLKALPFVDTVGLSLQLNNLIIEADTLPFVAHEAPATELPAASKSESGYLARAWQYVKQLVRVRKLDTPDPALYSPTQAYFLRENLKLRLLSARMALMARDDASFRADLTAAQEILFRHFDKETIPVISALNTIKHVAGSHLDIALPDLSSSVDGVKRARIMHDKAGAK